MTVQPDDPPDKEHALREDIRLLGRLLGDVVRDRAGAAAFTRVETIRQTAVAFEELGTNPIGPEMPNP